MDVVLMQDPLSPSVTARDALALVRAGGAAYYRHLDLDLVRRIGGVALAIVAVATLAVLPVAPPTAHAEAAGWAVTGGLLAVAALTAFALVRSDARISIRATYVLALAAVAGLGVVDWLAGDDAPYDRLLALPIIWAAATHTPLRVLAVVVMAAAVRLPLISTGGFGSREVAETAVQVLVWAGLAALAVVWTAGVRVQRGALRRLEAQARALARVDQLTGLGNRRAFDEAAAAEIARGARARRPLSLLVADLDGFKAINDDHGHLAGDDCLRQVAGVLRAELRRPDTCFRWGGDEFAVLLAEADADEAQEIGARLGDAVATTCRAPTGRPLTFGFGVAELAAGDTPEALLARADAALLVAKG
jgi:diguanylate cyclase (GGDEF)-like protein